MFEFSHGYLIVFEDEQAALRHGEVETLRDNEEIEM